VHKDHVAAVTSIDYAPTGLEFVTGSYDKSIRIFENNSVCIILIVAKNYELIFYINLIILGTFKRDISY